MKPRAKFLLFVLPWLLILSVPQWRLPARIVLWGSEYASSNTSIEGAISALRLIYPPLQPTANQLAARFAPGEAPPEIQLKAGATRGQRGLSLAEAALYLDAALQKRPNDPWLLCARLQVAIADMPDSRAYESKKRLNWAGGYTSPNRALYPIAGRGSGDLWGGHYRGGNPSNVTLKGWTLHAAAAESVLKRARQGRVVEPDNAFWDVQSAYVLALAGREDEAAQALRAAAQLPRYDSHEGSEVRAAIAVARLHRDVSGIEMLGIAERQFFDVKFEQRAYALLDLAVHAEKRGDLSVAAALAHVAERMRSTARKTVWLSLIDVQAAAWAGPTVKIVPIGSAGYFGPAVGLSAQMGVWTTPGMHANRFALKAIKQGQPQLAKETRRLGENAMRAYNECRADLYPLGLSPLPLINSDMASFGALLTAFQLELLAVAWLILQIVFWRRLGFVGLWAARGWQIIALSWRTRERDENTGANAARRTILTPTTRELRLAFWFVGLLTLAAAAALSRWNMGGMRWLHLFGGTLLNGADMGLATIGFFLIPLLGSVVCCFSSALWRYTKLNMKLKKSQSALAEPVTEPVTEPVRAEAEHIPPSIIPTAVAFMVWSVTALPLIVWALFAATRFLTPIYGATFLVVAVPMNIASLTGQSTLDFSVTDAFYPILATVFALLTWALKWFWELPSGHRWPMIGLALRTTNTTLGASLIVGSWLFLVFIAMSASADYAVVAEIHKVFGPLTALRQVN